MITQKRNLLRALIFGVTLAIVSAAGTQLAPLSTPTTSTPTTTKPISPAAPTKWTLPAGIFSQGLGQVHEMQADGLAYDDFDDYVPYRSDEHDHFSWELIKEVLHKERRNVVISPFAVKQLLALLSEAAGNNTQTQRELMRTLTDIRAPDNLRGFYKKVLPSLKKPNPYYTLSLETKLYTDAYIEPQQRFAAIAKDFYATDIERLQFSDAVASAHSINAWCANVTHGRLQQVVTEGNVENAVMLLINAIYFNGLWRRQFNETFPSVFFRTPTDQMHVQYMEQTEYFYHYDSSELNAKILRLPYKGKKFSMFVLLPKEKGGVDALAQNLGTENLKRMQWMMEEVKVKVTLPKFKFDFNQNLKETLKVLGINEIFTDHASLPGLARGADVARKLRVSNVLQKAGIDVNELGTEAFAATVIEIENKFGGSTVIEEFNVNRPFIFFIEEEATGNILFAGKVHEPHV